MRAPIFGAALVSDHAVAPNAGAMAQRVVQKTPIAAKQLFNFLH